MSEKPTWRATTIDRGHTWSASLVAPDLRVERTHPIPFTDRGEAERAVARLNARDAGITGVPAPTPPEDEVRAARQARIAELRGRRQPVE